MRCQRCGCEIDGPPFGPKVGDEWCASCWFAHGERLDALMEIFRNTEIQVQSDDPNEVLQQVDKHRSELDSERSDLLQTMRDYRSELRAALDIDDADVVRYLKRRLDDSQREMSAVESQQCRFSRAEEELLRRYDKLRLPSRDLATAA